MAAVHRALGPCVAGLCAAGAAPRLFGPAPQRKRAHSAEFLFPASVARCDTARPVQEGGNLRFPVRAETLSKAKGIIDQLQRGETMSAAIRSVGEVPLPPLQQSTASESKHLVVIYTDLEPDDAMAVAQLLQWKREQKELGSEPLIIFCVDFAMKDSGTVFEKKRLMAARMTGLNDCFMLTHDGDEGVATHPKAKDLAALRSTTVGDICRKLTEFDGSVIDFYIMAPGHGNLGAIISQLQSDGVWPLRKCAHVHCPGFNCSHFGPKWRVSLYSGSFNTTSMSASDLAALSDIMRHSDTPMVDLSKFPFFGGRDCLKMTGGLGTFFQSSFASEIANVDPLLAAAILLFTQEFNRWLIHPTNPRLFRGSTLDDEEEKRLAKLKEVFDTSGDVAYAKALRADDVLWKKVVGYKQPTVASCATEKYDGPLCDQLLFLYEWLVKEHPEWLIPSVQGKWCLDAKSGFTSIDPEASGGIRAIQPVLRAPKDEAALNEMSEVMQKYILRHVRALQKSSL